LPRNYAREFVALANQPTTDAPLRAQLALVLGSLQPDARQTGERLLQYRPPAPTPPGPPSKEE
jgi:hypothetical protein